MINYRHSDTWKEKQHFNGTYSMTSPVVITVGFACDLKQEDHYYPFAFWYVLGASCHHLRLMLHLDDMLVKACCWVPAIHAWVSRERRSCLTHMEWDPEPEDNLCEKNYLVTCASLRNRDEQFTPRAHWSTWVWFIPGSKSLTWIEA